jgi:hypothetical protein
MIKIIVYTQKQQCSMTLFLFASLQITGCGSENYRDRAGKFQNQGVKIMNKENLKTVLLSVITIRRRKLNNTLKLIALASIAFAFTTAVVAPEAQAVAYWATGTVERYINDSTLAEVPGATITLYDLTDNQTAYSTTGASNGDFTVGFANNCHNGNSMQLVAEKIILGNKWSGSITYTAGQAGTDNFDQFIIYQQSYVVNANLGFSMESATLVAPGVNTVNMNAYYLPGCQSSEAVGYNFQISFDPNAVQCIGVEPYAPFLVGFDAMIDNNTGLVIAGAGVTMPIMLGDKFNATPVCGITWESVYIETPQGQTCITTDDCFIATTNGSQDPIHGCTWFRLGPVPDVVIAMIADENPVVARPGGSFRFEGRLWNNTLVDQVVDVWTMVNVPGHGLFGPLLILNEVLVQPQSFMVAPNAVQRIPGYAPLGEYDYISFCGDYPGSIMDSFSFDIIIESPMAPDPAQDWNTCWRFTGSENGSGEVAGELPESPTAASYPNPFNAQTNISFNLPVSGDVSLKIYNLRGQNVATLVDGTLEAGQHNVVWDASYYSSGIYFYRLTAGDKVFTKRMTLLK